MESNVFNHIRNFLFVFLCRFNEGIAKVNFELK